MRQHDDSPTADRGETSRTTPANEGRGTAAPAITFDDVCRAYGTRTPFKDDRRMVLDHVNLTVPRGAILCLLGPSGAGKTTMVNLVMGNITPTSGTVRVLGEKAPYPHIRRRIGYMPQDEALYDDITAEENLRFFGAMNGMRGKALDARVEEALAFGRLTEHRGKLVSSYSGGMKRRLSLGVAMLHEPELMVLDEPTVGLDPDHRQRIWRAFRGMAAEGTTLLVTTHVMDEAARCDRIAMLNHGHIVAADAPARILERTGAMDLEEAFLTLTGANNAGTGTDPDAAENTDTTKEA